MKDWLIYDQFWDLTISGLALGSIYGLVALGYTLVYGVLRLINFAHSEIFMLGTFGTVFAVEWLGITKGDPAKTGFALVGVLIFCAIVSMAISGGAAVALERVAYRPLRKRNAPRLVALITAIGMSVAISEFWANTINKGRNNVALPDVMANTKVFTFLDATVTNKQILIITSAIGAMVLLDQFVARTRLGRGIRAVAQDSETATLMGVNRDRVITYTFLIGGVMAGFGGMLYMIRYGITRYDVGFLLGVKAFTAAVLGGIGNLRGALLGGLVLGLVENYGSAIFGSQWRDVIAYVTLVVVLMVRPTGLLGESLGRARV